MTGENVLLSCRIEAMAMLKVRPLGVFCRLPPNSIVRKNVALGKRAECTLWPALLLIFRNLRLVETGFLIFDQETST